MFADASTLRRTPILLLAVVAVTAVGLTGCGQEEEVDPYVYTTMARVMDGDTTSAVNTGGDLIRGALFEIDTPEALEYAKGDVGIVRSGNRLEFMVAPDIANNFGSWRGAVLGVQKRYSHGADTPHLFVKRVRNGELITPVDSVETYILPSIFEIQQSQLETPGAPLPDLDWQRVSRIQEFYPENEGDALIEVQSIVENFVKVLRHDLTDEQRANPTEADYAWYAVFPSASFRIVNLSDGAKWMLELLKEQNLPLVGSFSIARVEEERRERRTDHEGIGHLCGDIQVNWFKYANTHVRGN